MKLVIFDMDGLLFDTERLFMNKKNELLPAYGYAAREEDYIATLGLSDAALIQKMQEIYGEDYPAEEITARVREKVNAHIRAYGPPVKPGIKALLEALREKGIACCVASSTRREDVELYLAQAGLQQYFAFVIGGDEVARSKPAPDIFLKACDEGGVKPAQALVLEDSENGIRAAAAAGIPVICVPDLKAPGAEVAELCFAIAKDAGIVASLIEN